MLRNRKNQEERNLIGVNRVADPTKLKLGMFESLQNWIPAKRYKIKKKRGPELLVSTPNTINPLLCGGICPAEQPGAQTLPVVCCYLSDGWEDLSDNNSAALNYIAADQSFWHTVGEQSGFGSPYPPSSPKKFYVLEPVDPDGPSCDLQEVTPVALPGSITSANIEATQTAQAGRCGKSDEKSYILALAQINGGAGQTTMYFGETANVGVGLTSSINCGHGGAAGTPWTKYGNDFFAVWRCIATESLYLAKWDVSVGGDEVDFQRLTNNFVVEPDSSIPGLTQTVCLRSLHATENYLWALVDDDTGFAGPRIYQINKSTLAYIQHWEITDADWAGMYNFHVYSDDLIFIINNDGTNWRIGWFQPSTETVFTIDTLVRQCVGDQIAITFSATAFLYRDNYFYLTSGGFGIGDANVLKLGPLTCPGHSEFLWE